MKKARIIMTFILLTGLLILGMLFGNGIPQNRNANDKRDFAKLQSSQPEPEREADGYCVEKQQDGTYQCYFYGKDRAVLRSESSARHPHVEVLPSGYIKYTVQAGTGVGTQWGFFFDRDKEIFSESFTAILDQKDQLVVLGTAEGIVIRSIFDDSCREEITQFSQEFAPAATPVFDAAFSEKDGFVSVSYYSGQEFQIVTEEIMISAGCPVRGVALALK